MFPTVRRAAEWAGRHSVPAVLVTAIIVGAAGGGIGYATAAHQVAAAPVASTTAVTGPSRTGTAPPTAAQARPGAAVMARILKRFAAEIGVPPATVRAELKTRSIDDVIRAAGKDPVAVEQDILAELKTLGDHAAGAGKITPQQETAWLAMAKPEVERLMADAPAQRTSDLRALLRALRAHRAAVPAPAP